MIKKYSVYIFSILLIICFFLLIKNENILELETSKYINKYVIHENIIKKEIFKKLDKNIANKDVYFIDSTV